MFKYFIVVKAKGYLRHSKKDHIPFAYLQAFFLFTISRNVNYHGHRKCYRCIVCVVSLK